MEKSEFNYYIHKTAFADYNSFFKNGVIDFDTSFKIESTMQRISDDDIANGYLETYMKNLRETDENVILIKIPKCYFPDHCHRDGNWDVPIPLFYEAEGKDPIGREGVYPILIPNLIQGCYNRHKGFINNEGYCPVFDPSGLKFSEEQLEPMHRENYYKYNDYLKRNKCSMSELYIHDKSNKTWDSFIKYYSAKFGITNPTEYDMPFEENNQTNIDNNNFEQLNGIHRR